MAKSQNKLKFPYGEPKGTLNCWLHACQQKEPFNFSELYSEG